jgi:hypothetical protein
MPSTTLMLPQPVETADRIDGAATAPNGFVLGGWRWHTRLLRRKKLPRLRLPTNDGGVRVEQAPVPQGRTAGATARAAYAFVLVPFVTMVLSARSTMNLSGRLAAGWLLVLAGVYVGVLRPQDQVLPMLAELVALARARVTGRHVPAGTRWLPGLRRPAPTSDSSVSGFASTAKVGRSAKRRGTTTKRHGTTMALQAATGQQPCSHFHHLTPDGISAGGTGFGTSPIGRSYAGTPTSGRVSGARGGS